MSTNGLHVTQIMQRCCSTLYKPGTQTLLQQILGSKCAKRNGDTRVDCELGALRLKVPAR